MTILHRDSTIYVNIYKARVTAYYALTFAGFSFQVLPTLVQHLPLQEDKDEHITVINCLAVLYTNRHPAVSSVVSAPFFLEGKWRLQPN